MRRKIKEFQLTSCGKLLLFNNELEAINMEADVIHTGERQL